MTKKKAKKPKEKETQLDLGMKEPLKNRFFKAKGKADKVVRQIEVKKSLKDPLTWAVIIISIILIATQAYMIYENIDTLPNLLPIFQYRTQFTAKLVDKLYILTYPAISLVTLLITIVTTTRTYSREIYLSKILLISTLLVSTSSAIILIELINKF